MNNKDVAVFDENNSPIPVGPNGELGTLEGMDKVLLRVLVCENAIGIQVDGNKNVDLRRPALEGERQFFIQNVRLFPGQNGFRHTHVNSNSICVAQMENAEDEIEISVWQAVIASQSGNFFLVVDKKYGSLCYQDDSRHLVCPGFSKWPSLVAKLESVMNGIPELPHISSAPPEEKKPAPQLGENEAVVLWWDNASQTGAVETASGEKARVHWSQVEPRLGGRAYLVAGERVFFESLEQPIPNSLHPTTFRWEARGIIFTPLEDLNRVLELSTA